jgi:hypothetical protein
MADITMCVGTDCPNKERCYRFYAPVNEYRQAYFMDIPLKKDGTCDELWIRKEYKL